MSSVPPGRALKTQIGVAPTDGARLCPSCEARYSIEWDSCPRDGTALVTVDDIIGTTLSGTYFVRRSVGQGGVGQVYEARHMRLPQKRFAIKVLHAEFLSEPRVLMRFQLEAEAAAQLSHPNVAAIIDVDRTANGRPFLVVEYLEGKDLNAYLHDVGKLPVPAAVRIALQMVDALAAAHKLGIVHRDVKPENTFLTGDLAAPIAKLVDFGVAWQARRDGDPVTAAGGVVGTPSYMPPEQARGDRVDHRADIYAVGAILYTALTGCPPFDRPEVIATLLAVLNEEAPRPRSLEPSIPEALEAVILRAMARIPDERYQTMTELGRALEPFAGDAGVHRGSGTLDLEPRTTQMGPKVDERLVNFARPVLAGLLSAGFGWAALASAAALGTAMRLINGDADAPPTAWQTVLVVVLDLLLFAPAVYLARREIVRRAIWRDTRRGADLIRWMAPSVFAALSVYGGGAAAARAIEALFIGHALRGAWSSWDVTLLLLGLVGAGAPVGIRMAEMSRPNHPQG